LDEILKGVRAIHWEVNEVRLIGGEPFLYKDLDVVIEECAKNENIRYVMVYTNGTMLPSVRTLTAMTKHEVIVLITEYEGLSRKADELRERLDKALVTHHTIPTDYWTDCGEVYHRGRKKRETYEVFGNCCANRLYTMYGNTVYLCPFEANARHAGLIPKDAWACEYCAGRPLDAPKIKAAVQK
jgi:hypothetical protein